MSRRRDRRQSGGRAGRPGGADRPGGPDRADPAGRADLASRASRADRADRQDSRARQREARAGILRDLAVLAAAFGVGVGAAELFGAANLGVAFGVGQVVFALTLIVLLTRE
jgi:hypothetical protein